MEEIEVGEYVRTIDGFIRKVIKVNKKGSYEGLCYGTYSVDKKYKNSVGISAKKIVKHSKNITDLIEIGDILRIKVQFHPEIKPRYMLEEIKDKKTSTWKNILEQIELCHYEIVEILTKEQYNANCYRLEE